MMNGLMLNPVVTAFVIGLAVFAVAMTTGAVARHAAGRTQTLRSLGLISSFWSPLNGLDALDGIDGETSAGVGASRFVPTALGRFLIRGRSRRSLERLLAGAGRTGSRALEAVVARKITWAAGGLALGVLLGMMFGGAWWLAAAALPLAVFWLPDLQLHSLVTQRRRAIAAELPDALDLMDMCVQAGLGLQSALARVATTQRGPVAVEFARVLRETQLGKSRVAALEDMAQRCAEPNLTRVVGAMVQADRLGIPIAAVLRELARDMRGARASAAREQAQKLPVKLLAPLMACFMPALFIVILGPAAFRIGRTLLGS